MLARTGAAVAIVAAAISTAGIAPAQASGSQCQVANGQLWANQCLFVSGDGTRVDNVRITYTNPGNNICDRYSGTWGVLDNGGNYYKESIFYGGCLPAFSSSAITTLVNLKSGTTMFGHMNVSGTWISGIPGVNIW